MAEMVHASPPRGGPRFIQETARRVSVCGDGQRPWGGSASSRSVSVRGEGRWDHLGKQTLRMPCF